MNTVFGDVPNTWTSLMHFDFILFDPSDGQLLPLLNLELGPEYIIALTVEACRIVSNPSTSSYVIFKRVLSAWGWSMSVLHSAADSKQNLAEAPVQTPVWDDACLNLESHTLMVTNNAEDCDDFSYTLEYHSPATKEQHQYESKVNQLFDTFKKNAIPFILAFTGIAIMWVS